MSLSSIPPESCPAPACPLCPTHLALTSPSNSHSQSTTSVHSHFRPSSPRPARPPALPGINNQTAASAALQHPAIHTPIVLVSECDRALLRPFAASSSPSCLSRPNDRPALAPTLTRTIVHQFQDLSLLSQPASQSNTSTPPNLAARPVAREKKLLDIFQTPIHPLLATGSAPSLSSRRPHLRRQPSDTLLCKSNRLPGPPEIGHLPGGVTLVIATHFDLPSDCMCCIALV